MEVLATMLKEVPSAPLALFQGGGRGGGGVRSALLNSIIFFNNLTINQNKAQIVLEWKIKPSMKEMNFFVKALCLD